jgi:hypothetical protein
MIFHVPKREKGTHSPQSHHRRSGRRKKEKEKLYDKAFFFMNFSIKAEIFVDHVTF